MCHTGRIAKYNIEEIGTHLKRIILDCKTLLHSMMQRGILINVASQETHHNKKSC